jgi:hypothetical protein
MPRILFFLAIAFLVGLAVRTFASRRPSAPRGADAEKSAAEPLVQCAWCGAHMTGTSTLMLPDGRMYCSVAHRDAAAVQSRERR